jgi:hypothetical protein
MKKYLICLLVSTSILSASDFTRDDGMVPNLATGYATSDYQIPLLSAAPTTSDDLIPNLADDSRIPLLSAVPATSDDLIPNLAAATMTLPELVNSFLTAKIDKYITDSPSYTAGGYDLEILKLAKRSGPGLLANKVEDFIRIQLVKFSIPTNGYDIELIKFASEAHLFCQERMDFLNAKIDEYITDSPRYTTGGYDLEILKLAKNTGPGHLSDKVNNFIRSQLVKFSNPTNGYDIELIKLAMTY